MFIEAIIDVLRDDNVVVRNRRVAICLSPHLPSKAVEERFLANVAIYLNNHSELRLIVLIRRNIAIRVLVLG